MPRRRLLLLAGLAAFACGDDLPTVSFTTGTTGSPPPGTSTGPTADSTGAGSSSSSSSTGEPGPACGTDSAAALARCVDQEAIADDVGFIADIRIPGTPHWLAVQEMCADRLTMLGFDVQLHEYATGINVVGRRLGTTRPQELVLIGAHYDHIPNCLGADDNATGVAGALEVGRVLTQIDTERTVAIGCWDEEELGLLGSSAWVALGKDPEETVVAYYNYDMIGFATDEPDTQGIPFGFDAIFPEQYAEVEANEFRGDFILMAADELAQEQADAFVAHAQLLELPTVPAILDSASKNSDLFSDLRRSDHAPFWAADIPALFFTDSANFRNPAYHCASGEDTIESLDFAFARNVTAATVGSAAETLGMPRGE